jgi:hypothetical protein
MEFAKRPGLTNSNSEAATYGFVDGITPENIVVNRDNYVVQLLLGPWNAGQISPRKEVYPQSRRASGLRRAQA